MIRFLMLTLLGGVVTIAAQEPVLDAGPMPGYSAKRAVKLWLQTKKPSSVQIKYWDVQNTRQTASSTVLHSSTESDHILCFDIVGLEPGKLYEYDVLINGKKVTHDNPWTFRTQPLWEWRQDPPEFTLAFGSCAFVNEVEYDRPGKPYGSDYQIFDSIAALKPDLMLWLGDNVYLREADWDSPSGIRHRYRHTRTLPQLQRLLQATHHYAIWDDHDFGPNNSDRSYAWKEVTLNVFKQYWANPFYGWMESPGVFFQFRWHDIDFFMLDDRYHRSPTSAKNDVEKTMLGSEQKQWLKDALLSSRAPFKMVVCGSQMLNTLGHDESFNLFPQERLELLSFIRDNAIGGVVFLSGDVHHSVLNRMTDSTFYPLYDFTASSLTAGLYVPKADELGPMTVPGTIVSDQHNYGILRFSGPFRNRTLTMEVRDVTGKIRWTFSVNEKELKPAKR